MTTTSTRLAAARVGVHTPRTTGNRASDGAQTSIPDDSVRAS